MKLATRHGHLHLDVVFGTLVLLLMAVMSCGQPVKEQPAKVASNIEQIASGKNPADVRIGVYDSRSIALAYWNENVNGKPRLQDPNSFKGMTGIEGGIMMHQQVFSYHKPVQALEYMADKIPEVMRKAGVDVIVSEWDKEELAKYGVVGSGWDDGFFAKNPRVIDVTLELTRICNPNATREEYQQGFGRSKPEPYDADWTKGKE